jgi:hypothetical protein
MDHRVVATLHSRVRDVADVRWQSLDIRHREDAVALTVETREHTLRWCSRSTRLISTACLTTNS